MRCMLGMGLVLGQVFISCCAGFDLWKIAEPRKLPRDVSCLDPVQLLREFDDEFRRFIGKGLQIASNAVHQPLDLRNLTLTPYGSSTTNVLDYTKVELVAKVQHQMLVLQSQDSSHGRFGAWRQVDIEHLPPWPRELDHLPTISWPIEIGLADAAFRYQSPSHALAPWQRISIVNSEYRFVSQATAPDVLVNASSGVASVEHPENSRPPRTEMLKRAVANATSSGEVLNHSLAESGGALLQERKANQSNGTTDLLVKRANDGLFNFIQREILLKPHGLGSPFYLYTDWHMLALRWHFAYGDGTRELIQVVVQNTHSQTGETGRVSYVVRPTPNRQDYFIASESEWRQPSSGINLRIIDLNTIPPLLDTMRGIGAKSDHKWPPWKSLSFWRSQDTVTYKVELPAMNWKADPQTGWRLVTYS